jgi:Alkaline phytoceramidase (aPHC).
MNNSRLFIIACWLLYNGYSLELPMIYLVTLMNFMAVEFASPQGKPKYPKLPLILLILVLVNTLIYYKFQHLYLVFIATYTAITSYHLYLVYSLIYKNNAGGHISKKLSRWSVISYLGSFVLWLVDMFYCEFSSLLGIGMTFHVIWHFGAGFGAYLGIVSLENCRCVALDIPCELDFMLFGCIPFLKRVDDSSKDD